MCIYKMKSMAQSQFSPLALRLSPIPMICAFTRVKGVSQIYFGNRGRAKAKCVLALSDSFLGCRLYSIGWAEFHAFERKKHGAQQGLA